MASSKGPNDFFKRVVGYLPEFREHRNVLEATGPLFLTSVTARLEGIWEGKWGTSASSPTRIAHGNSGSDFLLVDNSMFLAPKWDDKVGTAACLDTQACREAFPNAYSVSHWT